jgi:hypothetical protein
MLRSPPLDTLAAVVSWRVRCCDVANEMVSERAPGDHYGRARRGRLGEPSAAQSLRGSVAATAWQEVDALFDPYGQLAEPADVSERCGRHRKERRRRCTLELPSAHFAA